MKTIPFCKYQGTGNDFVLIDNRAQLIDPSDNKLIARLCDRKFGVGADGLILLQNKEGYDFQMIYFNADGNESTMCGNGGRCLVAFAKKIGIIQDKAFFLAIDGDHEANVDDNNWVELKMSDVDKIVVGENYIHMDTGSPHHIVFVSDLSTIDVYTQGKTLRYGQYGKEGCNINFVELMAEGIEVATYERGVEDETLSCGTGVTAAAIAYHLKYEPKIDIPIKTKGGRLSVRFEREGNTFKNVYLCGPATYVFEGKLSL